MNKTIALVAIAKNEEPYICEWLAYHKAIGFDHVFLYDNGNKPNLQKLTKKFGDFVTVRKIKKIKGETVSVQIRALQDALQNGVQDYKWVSTLDIDEFLALKKHRSVKEFIQDYQDYSQILIHWYIFGHNGFYDYSGENITKTHLYRKTSPDENVKCIAKTAHLHAEGMHFHACKLKESYLTVNVDKQVIQPATTISITNSNQSTYIFHYQCRSYLQLLNRAKRGSAAVKQGCGTGVSWKKDIQSIQEKFVTYFSYVCNAQRDEHMLQFQSRINTILEAT